MKNMRSDSFNAAPYDIAWIIRDSWLGNIKTGLKPVQNELIPRYEMEAARILRNETLIYISDEPDRNSDIEAWRRWWMNEAHHLSTHSGITPDADYNLPEPCRHAINVLNAASELRSAMESKDVEKTALFAVLLAMETLQGGYSELEAAKNALDMREEKGIGKGNAKYKRLEQGCIRLAEKLWSDDQTTRIGDMVENILNRIFSANDENREIPVPSRDTIKGWLIEANKSGKLTIPPAARKGGRPKNK